MKQHELEPDFKTVQNFESELDFETKHLAHIIAIAKKQRSAIQAESGKTQAELIDTKRELWENTSHAISNLWSKDSFYELAALSQYENQVSKELSALESKENTMLALEKMIKSPYFARIDFQFEGEESAEKVYIGRATLVDDDAITFYVYDWRTPLASVFYRFGTGKAFYDAPGGRMQGEVSLKRQFEIRDGTLEYFFDADAQIQDEFLRKLLSQNASQSMKTIVETIQRDQDIIIRDMENQLMMVQGAAGSGKTSVALHRVAYFMYQGLATRLAAHNIVIISPNTLFERYISNVLPQLGEDHVSTLTFEKIIQDLLPLGKIQEKNQWLETLMDCRNEEKKLLIRSAMEFKTSDQFAKILNRFVKDIPRRHMEFTDVQYDGMCFKSRALLKAKILAKGSEPLAVRLSKLEKSIWKEIHEMRKIRMKKLKKFAAGYSTHAFEVDEFARLLSIAESTALLKQIHKFTRLDVLCLYKKIFSDWAYFLWLAKGMQLPPGMEQIFKTTQESLQGEILPYEDGLAVAFLKLKLGGLDGGEHIKQVVIDEAQDYGPMHFEILKTLFPKARYTILGDICQTVENPKDLGFFDEVCRILEKKTSTLMIMNKSFRCTREILDFSKKFLPPGIEIESFSRSGEVPGIFAAKNQETFDKMLIDEIQICQASNYQSVGLLCKTEREGTLLYERLKEKLDVHLIPQNGRRNIGGILIMPIYMAKGLEFDAVLLCDVSSTQYVSENDGSLLYIGCTRALHRLNLFCIGEKSPLLNEKGGV